MKLLSRVLGVGQGRSTGGQSTISRSLLWSPICVFWWNGGLLEIPAGKDLSALGRIKCPSKGSVQVLCTVEVLFAFDLMRRPNPCQDWPVVFLFCFSALRELCISFPTQDCRLIWGILMSAILFLQMCRVASWAEHGVNNLMDDQQDKECASEDQETILINGVKEDGKDRNLIVARDLPTPSSAFWAQRPILNGAGFFCHFQRLLGGITITIQKFLF